RGMVHDAVTEGRDEPMWLLFGVRSEADLLFGEELTSLALTQPWLRIIVTLSRPPPTWKGLTGYVQTHVKSVWGELLTLGEEPQAYVCGVKKMLFAVRDVLRNELGVDRRRVHLESYD